MLWKHPFWMHSSFVEQTFLIINIFFWGGGKKHFITYTFNLLVWNSLNDKTANYNTSYSQFYTSNLKSMESTFVYFQEKVINNPYNWEPQRLKIFSLLFTNWLPLRTHLRTNFLGGQTLPRRPKYSKLRCFHVKFTYFTGFSTYYCS